jgi:transcriptional antiterminator NusG
MARGWFVIQVYTGYEKKAMSGLLLKKNSGTLKDVLLDVRVPEEEYIVERKNKKITRKRNLYPGYILAELDLPDDEVLWKRVYADIRGVNGVGMFLSGGNSEKRPSPLAYDDVKSIFEKTGEIKLNVAKLESGYSVGEKVKINEGPFKDFEGEIQEVHNDKNYLTVRVEIFGRLTPVELEFNQVQKV